MSDGIADNHGQDVVGGDTQTDKWPVWVVVTGAVSMSVYTNNFMSSASTAARTRR